VEELVRNAPWKLVRDAAWSRAAAALALCSALGGCGYSLAHKGGQPLRVPAFRNGTAEAEAGGLFTAELRAELNGRGRLAGDESQAPVIQGEIVGLRSYASALGSVNASAFRVEAQVRLRMPGYEDFAVGAEDFYAGVDVLGTEANRRAALRRLARSLSRELVERLEVAGRLR
jgi:hypothetical protein